MKKNVDALIIISNESCASFTAIFQSARSIQQCRQHPDDSSKIIAEIITMEGYVNVDF